MSIKIQTESDDMLSLEISAVTDQITDVEIRLDFKHDVVPEITKIKWCTRANGSCMVWSPLEVYQHQIKPNWEKAKTMSRSACGMPMQCYISAKGDNVVMVSVDDVCTPMTIRSGLVEETGELQWELLLFSEQTEKMREYSTVLHIDERRIPYEKMIRETAGRWYKNYPIERNPYATDPVYSTWYSYHQQVTPELLREIQVAAELGMKTVIVDDGWQTDDNSRGYAYCGDWKVAKSKIPNMKNFVDAVHEAGMKIMLWYSVPFVGIYSSVWESFRDKLLYSINGRYGVLDPRYPKVREYLVSTYEHAVRDWGLDGLKLDFIDFFALKEESCTSNPEMDMLSLEKAVCTLLGKTYNRLKTINPDILIEFRQGYVGPIMLTYGNMLRAGDCPMDAVTNRIRTINLRLTSCERAVHSDMLMWDYEDQVESAASQFINILFSVPQISMRIEELPAEHYAMLRFYLSLWSNHREILMDGELHALHPEANYTLVYAKKDTCMVAAAYSDKLLRLTEDIDDLVLVNGTGTDTLYLETDQEKYSCEIYDCMGQLTERGSIGQGVIRLEVPVSGVVFVKKCQAEQ